jgi:S-DNA-T family DNA segregation ATPase FtsK/SpoIIIE
VGFSEKSSSYKVKYKSNTLELQKDELRDEMTELASGFLTVCDMPVSVDLKNANLGIVGDRAGIHDQLKAIIAQLCFFQSYHETELIMITDEAGASEFDWIRWYPHCKVKSINISGLVCCENQRDQVLGNIAQVLKARKQKKDEEKKNGVFLPYYIFIIDSPKLVVNHSIMEYLQSSAEGMGFCIIYTTNNQANLPDNIKTIVLLNSGESGTLLINEGVLLKKQLRLQKADSVDFERMSRSLAPIIHNTGVSTQIPESVDFLEMYGVKKPSEIPIFKLWKQNASFKSLAVPLGVRAKNDYVYLDLHEKAHGPHGLVAGTTGSGKSEILQSYIG